MSFKKIPSGEYYYFRKKTGNTDFIVLATNGDAGVINLSGMSGCPSELVGKRVRVKLELIKEGEDE